MDQWTIVAVLGTLVGLFATVLTPIIKLIKAITELTSAMENMEKNVSDWTADNKSDHARLWESSHRHEQALCDHESRIRLIEDEK